MPEWLLNVLALAGTSVLTLTVTTVFHKVVKLPKELKAQKEAEKAKEEKLEQENKDRDTKIADLEIAINALPTYREQSKQIQTQLQDTDKKILDMCNEIKVSITTNREILNERLDRLEKREKNSIRTKLIDEYRLFTDPSKNPMLAWSEMEQHAFKQLVEDYEGLNGNDYVHETVLPAMEELLVIPMSDKETLLKLMQSRRL